MDAETGTKKDRLIAALQELAQSNAKSKRAQLEEIFDKVEEQLQSKTQKQVRTALEKGGLIFTVRSFETTCARIRKKIMERDSGRAEIKHSAAAETPSLVKSWIGEATSDHTDAQSPRPVQEPELSKTEKATIKAVEAMRPPPGWTPAAWAAEQAKTRSKVRKT